MNWSDIPRYPSPKLLRQFGGLAAAICLLMAGYAAASNPGTGGIPARTWGWLGAGAAAGLVAALRPGALRPVFVGWMMAAFPIGWIVGRLALVAMFFGLFTAVGLLFRMMGRDQMKRQRQSGSYWAPRGQSTTPSDYLRQF